MHNLFKLRARSERWSLGDLVPSVFALPFLTLFCTAAAPPALAEAIRSFDSSIMIAKDGQLAVEEKITYDFEGESRHGIERFIPVKVKVSGKKQRINIDVQGASDNLSNKFRVFESNGYKVIRIGSPDEKVTGVQTYQINYKVDGAFVQAAPSGAAAKLLWPVTGDKWQVPIDHVSVMVYSSEKTLLSAAKISAEYGSDRHSAKSEITSNSAILEASNLKPEQGLVLSVALPAGSIAQANEAQRAGWQIASFFDLGGAYAGMSTYMRAAVMCVVSLFALVLLVSCRILLGYSSNSRYSRGYYDRDNSSSGGSGGGGSGSGSGGGGSW